MIIIQHLLTIILFACILTGAHESPPAYAQTATTNTRSKEPPLPADEDPGGPVLAIFGRGVDYTNPTIAAHLARDGEGEAIGWDFTDNDIRPYAPPGPGTHALVHMLTQHKTLRLIILKEKPGDTSAFGHMMTFTQHTPARIIVWLTGTPTRPDWPILQAAAKHFPTRLFIVPAPPSPPAQTTPGTNGLPANVRVANPRPPPQNTPQTPLSPDALALLPAVLLAARAAEAWKKTPSLSAAQLAKKTF